MREFSSRSQRLVMAIVSVVIVTTIALGLLWFATNESSEAACLDWRADYRAAVRTTAAAIKDGDTEPAFERLTELDARRPEGCSVPIENVRPRCIECGHE